MASLLKSAKGENKGDMKGLKNFIKEIRQCPTKEQEAKRVNKELANIRQHFKEAKAIDGYARKKYVTKIVYMFMLGYEVDFGYMEALNLVASENLSEKKLGYLALGMLLHENHEMVRLCIQSIQNDIDGRSEFAQAMALAAIANIGGREMADGLGRAVQNLLVAAVTVPTVKKKAALTLLRLYRQQRTRDFISIDNWHAKLSEIMRTYPNHYGLQNSLMALILELCRDDARPYKLLAPIAIKMMHKIVTARENPREYLYYSIPSPWLQIKYLRFLRRFPVPDDKEQGSMLGDVIAKIRSIAEPSAGKHTQNHRNAIHAVLFESIYLLIAMDLPADREVIKNTVQLLGRFISAKETNVRYLALEALAALGTANPDVAPTFKRHQETVILSLRDNDISIRKRALQLLYAMCDKPSCTAIVNELMEYLTTADFAIREELVLKIAILAEKYAPNMSWYVDIILQLISQAGDFVPEEIWHRVIQVVTNKEEVQEYATKTVFEALNHPSCHETTVKVGGYILGEFGNLIADYHGTRPMDQFNILHSKFQSSSPQTKAILLSAYAKFTNLYPEEQQLVSACHMVFRQFASSMDSEIQQRACEYFNLAHMPQLLNSVWDVMPPYPDKNPESTLLTGKGRGGHAPAPLTQGDAKGDDSDLPEVEELPKGIDGDGDDAQLPTLADALVTQEFKHLCLAPDGVFYSDESVQIGLRSQYQRAQGKLMLYFNPKAPGGLDNFSSTVAEHEQVLTQPQEAPKSLGAGQQAGQGIMVSCAGEFCDAPVLTLKYTAGGQDVERQLALPIVATKFIEPYALNQEEFFANWKSAAGGAREWTGIVANTLTASLNIQYVQKVMGLGFHLGVLQGIDANPNNVICAGTFHSGSKQVVCLVRIETNAAANMYRVAVRSFSAQLTQALAHWTTAALGTLQQPGMMSTMPAGMTSGMQSIVPAALQTGTAPTMMGMTTLNAAGNTGLQTMMGMQTMGAMGAPMMSMMPQSTSTGQLPQQPQQPQQQVGADGSAMSAQPMMVSMGGGPGMVSMSGQGGMQSMSQLPPQPQHAQSPPQQQ